MKKTAIFGRNVLFFGVFLLQNKSRLEKKCSLYSLYGEFWTLVDFASQRSHKSKKSKSQRSQKSLKLSRSDRTLQFLLTQTLMLTVVWHYFDFNDVIFIQTIWVDNIRQTLIKNPFLALITKYPLSPWQPCFINIISTSSVFNHWYSQSPRKDEAHKNTSCWDRIYAPHTKWCFLSISSWY